VDGKPPINIGLNSDYYGETKVFSKKIRIHNENELVRKYGLKNKREIWKAETALRKYRGQARELLAKVDSDDPQIKKEVNQLLTHLTRYNILPLNSTLDDVLTLETESILARRLQTLTYLKGLANTPKQARQLIVQGHIAIGENRITIPSYKITKKEENDIEYAPDSPLNDVSHPARPSADFKSKLSKKILGEESKEKTEKKKPSTPPPKKTEKPKKEKPEKKSKKPADEKKKEQKPETKEKKNVEQKKDEEKQEKKRTTKEQSSAESKESSEKKDEKGKESK
jgi:small subunit ribosomal protein S4